MKEQKTERYPYGSIPHKNGGWTFGRFLQASRDFYKRTAVQTAEILGISLEYYNDLENDKRYPPTGTLFKKISKVCDIVEITGVDADGQDDANVIHASDFAGIMRADIAPDIVEFLRRNWFARHIVELLMQADNDGRALEMDETLCETIRDSVYKIAENRGIKIIPPETVDEDDE